jgi:hypothetical protein
MSTGGTSGTSAADAMNGAQRVMMKYVAMPMMNLLGMMHGLETGAAHHVDALMSESFESGVFYASPDGKTTGALVDQATLFADLSNTTIQDHAYEAVQGFVS